MSSTDSSSAQIFLSDLVGPLLVSASVVYFVTLLLVYKGSVSVAQFSFGLSTIILTFLIGGIIDHQVDDETLRFLLDGDSKYRQQIRKTVSPTVGSWPLLIGAAILAAIASVAVGLMIMVCPRVPGPLGCKTGLESTSHQLCWQNRLASFSSSYTFSVLVVFTTIGMRLNARLGGSAITPTDGTLHWKLLLSPTLILIAHSGATALVWIYFMLEQCNYKEKERHQQSHGKWSRGSTLNSGTVESRLTPLSTPISHKIRDPLSEPRPLLEPSLSLSKLPMPSAIPRVAGDSHRTEDRQQHDPATSARKTLRKKIKSSSSRKHSTSSNQERVGREAFSTSGDRRAPEDAVGKGAATDTPASSRPRSAGLLRQRLIAGARNRNGNFSELISSDSEDEPAAKMKLTSSRLGLSKRPSGSSLGSSSGHSTKGERVISSADVYPASEAVIANASLANGVENPFLTTRRSLGNTVIPRQAMNGPTSATMGNTVSGVRPSSQKVAEIMTLEHSSNGPQTISREWVQCIDPASGQPYFYCASTGESRWLLPTPDALTEMP